MASFDGPVCIVSWAPAAMASAIWCDRLQWYISASGLDSAAAVTAASADAASSLDLAANRVSALAFGDRVAKACSSRKLPALLGLGPFALTTHIARAHKRAQVLAAGAAQPSTPKPHAMQPNEMLRGSPFATGTADVSFCHDALLTVDATALADYSATLATPMSSFPMSASPAPLVHGSRLLAAHLATAEWCQECQEQTCQPALIAQAASVARVPFFKNADGTSQRPTSHDSVTQYDLTPEEGVRLEADLLAGTAAGVFMPASFATSAGRTASDSLPWLLNPVFYTYKNSYAPMTAPGEGGKPAVDSAALSLIFSAATTANAYFHGRVAVAVATALAAVVSGQHAARATAAALATMVTVSAPRLVFDYSCLLNHRMAKWPMALLTMWQLVSLIGRGSWIAVDDLESGFWCQAVHPEDRPFLAIMIGGKVVTPTRLMFGLRNAPASFSILSGELAAGALRLCRQAGLRDVFIAVYIDDFAVFAPTEAQCRTARDILRAHVTAMGCRFKASKGQDPTQQPTLLGLTFNTRSMTVALPPDRRFNLCVLLAFVTAWSDAGQRLPRGLARKLAGKLAFASLVVPGGMGRIAPFWDAAEGDAASVSDADPIGSVSSAARWWLGRLCTHELAAPLIDLTPSGITPFLTSFSDASGDTAGAIIAGNVAMHHVWGSELSGPHLIDCQEMFPLAWLASTAGHILRNVVWQPLTDNAGNVYSLLRGSCRSSPLARRLHHMLWCGLHGSDDAVPLPPPRGLMLPTWQPREGNDLADAASKLTDADDFVRLLGSRMSFAPPVVPVCDL